MISYIEALFRNFLRIYTEVMLVFFTRTETELITKINFFNGNSYILSR